MLVTRAAFTLAVMATVVWLLLAGHPVAAVFAVVLGVLLRRSVDTGRFAGAAARRRTPL